MTNEYVMKPLQDVTVLIPAFFNLDVNTSYNTPTGSKLDDEDDLGCVSFKEKEGQMNLETGEEKCESGDFSDGDGEEAENVASHVVTSTPFEPGRKGANRRRRREFPDGAFYGFGRHRDGEVFGE